MQYSVLPDKEVPEEVRNEIQSCVDYYSSFHNEIVKFGNIYSEDITFIEKLKNTLYPKFPLKQNDKALWNWLCAVLNCEQEDDFIPPKTIKIMDSEEIDSSIASAAAAAAAAVSSTVITNLDDDEDLKSDSLSAKTEEMLQAEQKASELKVLSLQEQLCLPSGLNMNPVRMLSPLATPNPIAPAVVTVPSVPSLPLPLISAAAPTAATAPIANAAAAVLLPPLPPSSIPLSTAPTVAAPLNLNHLTARDSPRDSPITISSNSASPAKF